MPGMEFALASSMFDQCASRSALGQLSTTSALSPSQGEMTSYAAIFHGARSQYIAHSPVIRRRLVNGRRPPLSLGLEGMEATGFFFTFRVKTIILRKKISVKIVSFVPTLPSKEIFRATTSLDLRPDLSHTHKLKGFKSLHEPYFYLY
jgi:hypothetical protein